MTTMDTNPRAARRDSDVAYPTLSQVRRALERVLGNEFDGTWHRLCDRLTVDPTADDVDDEQFDRVLTGLEEADPLSRVVATSWRIRRTAARKLAELNR